jgi:hypothetical protein
LERVDLLEVARSLLLPPPPPLLLLPTRLF